MCVYLGGKQSVVIWRFGSVVIVIVIIIVIVVNVVVGPQAWDAVAVELTERQEEQETADK